MRGMILSAGYGTRLWPLTEDRTKPAIPILGKPLVGYVAEYLSHFGVRDILVNLHHRPQSVRDALGDGSRFGVNLSYIEEPVILGTSGALDNAREILELDTFVVVNGKIITDIDLNKALHTHRDMDAIATLVLLPNTRRERFTVVNTEGQLFKGLGGMPTRDDQHATPLMFTGIQILEPRIFEYIPRGVFSHTTTDVYPQAVAAGERVAVHIASGKWYELSTIQRYLDISLALLNESEQTVFIGKGSVISKGATVKDSILWDDVRIDSGAKVERALIADGVQIRAGEVIRNAAVVRAELVKGIKPPEKALKGKVENGNFVVPLTQ
jgi:NDP-sugar pyrophosphorylase family protein